MCNFLVAQIYFKLFFRVAMEGVLAVFKVPFKKQTNYI